MSHNIEQIWQAVLDGDVKAWATLVRSYAALVHTVARRVGLSYLDAEDCAQHTWMSLYRNRRVIKDPKALPAWLIKTTYRQATYISKRRSRMSDAESDRSPRPNEPLPDEEVQKLEQQAILQQAINRLDKRCQQLLRKLFFAPEDQSYADIAKSLGIAANTMGPLRSRCLKRLRKVLQEMGYEWD